MEYIADGILLLIFVVTVIVSAARGLTRGIAGIIAWVAAAFIALQFCAPLAQTAYEKCLQPTVLRITEEKITGAVDAGEAATAAAAAYNKLPQIVVNAAASAGVDVGALQTKAQNFIPDTQNIAASVEQSILAPVITAALKVVVFLLLVVGIAALGRLILSPVGTIVHKMPVIGQADKALGGVLGIVKGAILVSVLAIVLRVLGSVLGGTAAEVIGYSKIVSFVAESPFSDGFFR